ncbi:MAG: 30S ribosomal protein S2 [Sphaerochaetaceae bacterium]|nr:30S ribosomal protein S2 [uncultured Sphaerochaeta sp.]MDC7230508.1 30S ribosomal protein S2 [Sphaerochaetaceae bacterium]
MSVVTMKSLLESGVHFGHQTKRWNPKMARFIFSQRNGIHIIDLQKTSACIVEAYDAVRAIVKQGKPILFVGTKKQAQQAIEAEAKRCGMPYINNRWLGGMLTNFSTIKKSIATLKKIEKMEIDGTFESLTKKEVSLLTKQKAKLEKNLGGIKDMKELPGALFIIDTKKEAIAVTEAKRLGIPVIAVVDTNCDPTDITYPIPGNDDAIRAISLFVEIIANAVVDADNEAGIQIIEALGGDDEEEKVEETEEKAEETEEIVFSTEEGAEFSKFEEKENVEKEEVKETEEETESEDLLVDEETLYKD